MSFDVNIVIQNAAKIVAEKYPKISLEEAAAIAAIVIEEDEAEMVRIETMSHDAESLS